MQRFTHLKVRQRSHSLVLQICRLTAEFPTEERFGLVSQLRRVALSVPTNIAEGSKRQSNLEYARFVNLAEGSLTETEYLLMVAGDLGGLTRKSAEAPLKEVSEGARMLSALRSRVQQALGAL